MSGSPLAYNPHGIPAEEREEHFARIERLFGSALERRELLDGLAFSFPADLFADPHGSWTTSAGAAPSSDSRSSYRRARGRSHYA